MSGTLSNAQIEQQLAWRYATKRFNLEKKISSADWQTLEHSLLLAPSSFGLQPWHFVSVSDPALRQNLREASWKQPQVTDASHFVVLAARTAVDQAYVTDFIKRAAATRGIAESSLATYRGMIDGFLASMADKPGAVEAWATHQLYLALGMLLTTAAMLEIDACPLEGIDPTFYNQALGLPAKGFSTKVAVALGYRADDDTLASLEKVRLPAESVFTRR